jgi:hypothetical protein
VFQFSHLFRLPQAPRHTAPASSAYPIPLAQPRE